MKEQKILKKWNYKNHKYEDFNIPRDRNVKLLADDLNEIINCANCGKKAKFGDTYSSMTIHNSLGLGYCICEECYEKERKDRIKYKED